MILPLYLTVKLWIEQLSTDETVVEYWINKNKKGFCKICNASKKCYFTMSQLYSAFKEWFTTNKISDGDANNMQSFIYHVLGYINFITKTKHKVNGVSIYQINVSTSSKITQKRFD